MPVDRFSVADRVVIVTGASRGIGRAVAEGFLQAGARVTLVGRSESVLEQLEDGAQGMAIRADVSSAEDRERICQQTHDEFGRIDVPVNALGDSIRIPLVGLPDGENAGEPIPDDELDFIMDINLTEALLCTRAVGPHMLARGSGKVINISSWTGHQGGGEMVLYTTAKTALAGFTRAQALEWAPHGIQVNCIAPGLFPDIVTGGAERVRNSEERAKREVPLGRTGRLKEVGYLALYLASSASDYMTGQTIMLDGGQSL